MGILDAPRKTLIEHVKDKKGKIIDALESGDRDFEKLRNLVEGYIDYQKAADKLAEGYAHTPQ